LNYTRQVKIKPFPTPLRFTAAAVRPRGNGLASMPAPKPNAEKVPHRSKQPNLRKLQRRSHLQRVT
jgi:hypothetical protein